MAGPMMLFSVLVGTVTAHSATNAATVAERAPVGRAEARGPLVDGDRVQL